MGVIIGGLVVAHFYLWHWLSRIVPDSRRIRALVTYAIIALSSSCAVALTSRFFIDFGTSIKVGRIPLIWLTTLLILNTLLFIADCGLAAIIVAERRRQILRPIFQERAGYFRKAFLSAALLTALIATYAFHKAQEEARIKQVDITLSHLPRELEGFTILQLSDLHIGPILQKEEVAALVEKANSLRPDLIAITGDIVDGNPDQLLDAVAPLGQLKAPYGVYYITGNHDYYFNFENWQPIYQQLGLRFLHNEHVIIAKNQKDGFTLAGIDDLGSRGRYSKGHGPDLEKALAATSDVLPRILLSHRAMVIRRYNTTGIDLILSGHTHGGQFLPYGWISLLTEPFLSGFHRYNENSQIYISQGVSVWGPMMRLGTENEMTLIQLHSSMKPSSL
jgi:predicted MPP superfamily phosphohydrolase